jgi:hypothetical protein
MEENKFEKQVKQKMEDLKLEPSDAVWTKIEARLEKRKKSRWGILFLFLFLFMFISGAYWLWNTSQHSSLAKNNSIEKGIKRNIGQLPSSKEKEVDSKSNSAIEPIKENEKKVLAAQTHRNVLPHQKLLAHQKINPKINLKINPGEEGELVTQVQEPSGKNNSKSDGDSPAIKSYQQNKKINKENVISDATSVKINDDSLKNKNVVTNKNLNENDSTKNNTATTKKPKVSVKNKWKIGVSIIAGASHLNSVPGINNSYAYATDPSSSNSNQGAIIYGATLKQKPGFSLGISGEKNISTNTKISIGLNFTTFRSLYKVGNRNDTTGFYNSQNAVHNYNAHIDFVELPVSLKIQFVKSKNLPLFWQGGIVLSQIISTNALQFDPYSGKYYLDNSAFNKTQVGLNSSISVGLFSKKGNPLLIGPYLYYGASKIAKEGIYSDKHFVFTGLKASFLF